MNTRTTDPILEVKTIVDALTELDNVKQLIKRLEFIWNRYFPSFQVEYVLDEHFVNGLSGLTTKGKVYGLKREVVVLESVKLFRNKKNNVIYEDNSLYILLKNKELIAGYIKIQNSSDSFSEQEIAKLQIMGNFLNGILKNIFNEAVSGNEVNYELMVEKSADIIYSCDFNGNFTYINPAGLKLSGFKSEEVIGNSFLDFIDSDHREKAREFYQMQFSKMTLNTYYEYPIVKKNGQLLWLGQNVQLITKRKKIIRFHAVARAL